MAPQQARAGAGAERLSIGAGQEVQTGATVGGQFLFRRSLIGLGTGHVLGNEPV